MCGAVSPTHVPPALNLPFLSNQRPCPAPIPFLLTNKSARSYNTAHLKAIIRGGRLHLKKRAASRLCGCPFGFSNELPRGKPRSIGAKTTGVARNEAGYIPLPRRTPVSDIWQTIQYDIAKQKHCCFYECIDSCWQNKIT